VDELFAVIKDNVHVGLGGVLALFIYKDNVASMKTWERVAYCAASIFIGVYGGDGVNDWFSINHASNKAHAISILIAIFGLAILAIMRDKIKSVADKLDRKWFGD